jgi:hypothetical protein
MVVMSFVQIANTNASVVPDKKTMIVKIMVISDAGIAINR